MRSRDRAEDRRLLLLGLWTLVVLFPLYWVLVTSLKIEVQVDSGPYYFRSSISGQR